MILRNAHWRCCNQQHSGIIADAVRASKPGGNLDDTNALV
jgi:hypothetical protein